MPTVMSGSLNTTEPTTTAMASSTLVTQNAIFILQRAPYLRDSFALSIETALASLLMNLNFCAPAVHFFLSASL